MNVYDFDKTIYKKDCTLEFYKFCLHKKPRLIYYFPKLLLAGVMFFLNINTRDIFKERFYKLFLPHLVNVEDLVDEFWDKEINNIKPWYHIKKAGDDVIISASPSFLLDNIMNRLGIRSYIASNVNKNTGMLVSKNCRGEQKLEQFKKRFKDLKIDNFYSDSLSDYPIATVASCAFLVKKDEINAWPSLRKQRNSDTLEFTRFLFIGVINVINGTILAWVFSLVLQANIAFMIGYFFSLCISYLLMSIVVFNRQKLRITTFAKFCLGYIPNFVVQNLVVFISYNIIGSSKLIAYLSATAIAVPVTFFVMKFVVFRI